MSENGSTTLRTSALDYMALGSAVAQDVATTHVRGAVDEAVARLDNLGSPLTIEQHAVLIAKTEDALEGIAFCALALAYKIVKAEAEGESIPTLIDFMSAAGGDVVHALESPGHSVWVNPLTEEISA